MKYFDGKWDNKCTDRDYWKREYNMGIGYGRWDWLNMNMEELRDRSYTTVKHISE